MAEPSNLPLGLDPTAFSALLALAVLIVTRMIDALLPRGRSFKFMDRYLSPPKEDDDE